MQRGRKFLNIKMRSSSIVMKRSNVSQVRRWSEGYRSTFNRHSKRNNGCRPFNRRYEGCNGANAVNTMAESVSPLIERITNGRVVLRIISNLADKRIVRARGEFSTDMLGGIEIAKNIVSAYEFADADPYRAATHNKGVMNGITAAVLASGNDTRAVEAGAHAYAARSGRYRSLTTWELNKAGNLVGTLELPLAVGIVGGATKTHPVAKAALKLWMCNLQRS